MTTAGRTLYLCPPDFLDLEYEINPWMKIRNPFSREKARAEWDTLRTLYEELAPGQVEVLPEGAEGFGRTVAERGLAVRTVPMGEFTKFGGWLKCLTFQHYE